MVKPFASTFLGLNASKACFSFVHFAFSMLPDNVITPSATAAVTVGKSFTASFTAAVSGSSAVMATGAGGGGTVVLFTTDFTPLIPCTAVAIATLAASSATSPLNVATPSFTITITPDAAGLSFNAFSIDAFTSASFGLQPVNAKPAARTNIGNTFKTFMCLYCFSDKINEPSNIVPV